MLHQLFATNVFTYKMIGDDPYYQMTEERWDILVQECYKMRKRDPIGRKRSNADGWQSKDGVVENPIFLPMINRIGRFFQREVFPFYGACDDELKVQHGNYWVNLNSQGGHNHAHTHPGCWYSGTIYLQVPKGMESGGLQLIDQNIKHYSQFPLMSNRSDMWWRVQPEKGLLVLFPSGVYHFVEPNDVDADRISIAFNNSFSDMATTKFGGKHYDELPYGAVNTHEERPMTRYEDGMLVNPDGTLEFPK